MATTDSKAEVHQHDDVLGPDKPITTGDAVVNRIAEDHMIKTSAECLSLKSRAGFRLFIILIIMGFNQAGYGIDWAVIGNINSYATWHNYFAFENSGVILGTINGLMTIGTFVGAPFLATADVYGRRGVNFVGNLIVIIAALMQALAPNLACFMAGRFFLGFGTSMSSCPQYVAEIAPVHIRGRLVGWFGAFFQIGSLAMSAGMVGFSTAAGLGNWQWRAPLMLQIFGPLVVCLTIYWLCPESPRYLVMKNKHDEARQVVAKLMTTNNDINAPIVPLVIQQIEESLESDIGMRKAYDFRVFFTRAVGYRTMLLAVYSVFQQWNGGGIITYYISPTLDTIGITGELQQTGINLGLTGVYLVFTGVGAHVIDHFRRRTLIFAGLALFVIVQTCVTILSWRFSLNSKDSAAAAGVIAFIFVFQICSATLIATMHNLYPVELLSLPLRARGMGLFNMFQGAAGTVQSYGISVGIARVGYKIWVVYIVYNLIQLVVSYFVFPETSKLSLEEIDYIFETPHSNPVKLSLEIEKSRKELERAERLDNVSNV